MDWLRRKLGIPDTGRCEITYSHDAFAKTTPPSSQDIRNAVKTDSARNSYFYKTVPMEHLESIRKNGLVVSAEKNGANRGMSKVAAHDIGKQYITPLFSTALFYVSQLIDRKPVIIMMKLSCTTKTSIYTFGTGIEEMYVTTDIPVSCLYTVQYESTTGFDGQQNKLISLTHTEKNTTSNQISINIDETDTQLDTIVFTGRILCSPIIDPLYRGGSLRHHRIRPPTKWISTGHRIRLGDGSKRVLYRNPSKPTGELRIRRMVKGHDKTVSARYVKPH